MLVCDKISLSSNDPLGGCVSDNVVVMEEGAEQLNGSSSASGSTVGPIVLWEGIVGEVLQPEVEEAARSHHLWVMATILMSEQKEAPLRCPLETPMLTNICCRI